MTIRSKKRTSKTQKKRACFWTRETQNNELRTLSARENSFEYDYYVLSSELRQNKLAETNDRTLVMSQTTLIVDKKGSTKIDSPEDDFIFVDIIQCFPSF